MKIISSLNAVPQAQPLSLPARITAGFVTGRVRNLVLLQPLRETLGPVGVGDLIWVREAFSVTRSAARRGRIGIHYPGPGFMRPRWMTEDAPCRMLISGGRAADQMPMSVSRWTLQIISEDVLPIGKVTDDDLLAAGVILGELDGYLPPDAIGTNSWVPFSTPLDAMADFLSREYGAEVTPETEVSVMAIDATQRNVRDIMAIAAPKDVR